MPQGFLTTLVIVKVLSIPSERGAFTICQMELMLMKSTFQPNYKGIPETIVAFRYGISVMKNNFIFPMTDRAMDRMVQNGIPQYFIKYLDEVDWHAVPRDIEEPKIFELDDLAFGFYVFFATCGISFLAFVAELLYFYGKMHLALIVLLRALTSRKLFPCGELRH